MSPYAVKSKYEPDDECYAHRFDRSGPALSADSRPKLDLLDGWSDRYRELIKWGSNYMNCVGLNIYDSDRDALPVTQYCLSVCLSADG